MTNKDTKKQFRFSDIDKEFLTLATKHIKQDTGLEVWTEASTVRYLLECYCLEHDLIDAKVFKEYRRINK
jgi:hypothetical protein